jgi:coenzyme F420-reducing hydrogenase delta subunit
MNLLAIIVIAVGSVEIVIFALALILMGQKMNQLQTSQNAFNQKLLENLKKYLENMTIQDGKRMDISRRVCVQYDKFAEVFDTFIKTCDNLKGHYESIDDHFEKAMTAFDKAEDRYSSAYDQMVETRKAFKYTDEKIDKLLDEWSNCMNDITIWYETHLPEDKNNKLEDI